MLKALRTTAAVPLLLLIGALSASAEDAPQPLPKGQGPGIDQVAARPTLQRRIGAKVRVRWDDVTGCPRSVVFRPPLPIKSEFPKAAAWEVIRQIARLYGNADLHPQDPKDAAGPHLHLSSYRRLGDYGVVHFEQRIGAIPVEGSALRVVLSRRKGLVLAHAVRGRAFRDLPLRLRSIVGPAKTKPLTLGKLRLKGTAPRVVATPRGGWRLVHRTVELAQRRLWVVLRDEQGKRVHRRPLGNSAGTADAKVWKTRGDKPAETVRLRDLTIKGWQGTLMVTNDKGEFPGRIADLPWGFSGPQEAVSPDAGGYASALLGSLQVAFDDSQPARRDEATVFYHLVETRRWLQRYSDLPGMKAALKSRVAAVVRAAGHDASTLPVPAELGGRAYDHTLMFGIFQQRYLSRDATVISHERVHALLFDLGFSAVHHPLSEAICDYFSAVQHKTTKLGAYAMGAFGRDISELRVYPTHTSEDPHVTGWIFAGALWEARRTLGDKLDRAVLLAAPALGQESSLFDGRDQVLEAARSLGLDTKALSAAFARHGLGDPAGSNLRPRIQVSLGVTGEGAPLPVSDLLRLRANEPGAVMIMATDPEGKPVKLMTAGLEGVATRTKHADGAPQAMATYSFQPPLQVGSYTLTVTAEDADQRQSTHTIPLVILPAKKTTMKQAEHTIRVSPNLPYALPLSDLIKRLKLPQQAVEPGLDWRIVGPRLLDASLDDEKLYLRATLRDVGEHVLELRARPKDLAIERGTVRLSILVGPEARINVFAPAPKPGDSAPLLLLQPPGRDLVMHAGEGLELEVHGLGLGEVKAAFTLAGSPDARLAPLGTGSMLRTGAGRLGLVHTSKSTVQLRSLLMINPPADAPSGTIELTLGLKRTTGLPVLTRITTRTLRIHVLPRGKNRPPRISAPRVVISKKDRAVFTVSAADPEGGKVELSLAYPLPGLKPTTTFESSGAGAGKVRVVGSAGPELHIYLRAVDAEGNRSIRRVLLLSPKLARQRRVTVDHAKGIIEGVESN